MNLDIKAVLDILVNSMGENEKDISSFLTREESAKARKQIMFFGLCLLPAILHLIIVVANRRNGVMLTRFTPILFFSMILTVVLAIVYSTKAKATDLSNPYYGLIACLKDGGDYAPVLETPSNHTLKDAVELLKREGTKLSPLMKTILTKGQTFLFIVVIVQLFSFCSHIINTDNVSSGRSENISANYTRPSEPYRIEDGYVILQTWTEEDANAQTIIVPSHVDGLPVKEIDKLAFYNHPTVKTIQLPDTVTTIQSGAFMDCIRLESVQLPDSVSSIGAEAFQNCTSLQSITIPPLVTEIRGDAFNGCKALSSVTLHDGVTSLHARAFKDCSSLSTIILPEGIPEIPAFCFYGCSKLSSITIPQSVNKIGESAFENCWYLSSVKMPDFMAGGKISESAFRSCSKLEFIHIPDGVTKISAHAFRNCSSLRNVTIPSTLNSIGSSAFRDCSKLRRIVIPYNCEVDERSFKDSPTKIERSRRQF